MRNISSSIQIKLNQQTTSIALCWKITLKSGAIFTYTNHDKPIVSGGITYSTQSGYTSVDISSDKHTFCGFILDVPQDKIASYLNATVELLAIDSTTPNLGLIKIESGYINKITAKNGKFIAEISAIQLDNNIIETYSPNCRAQFCDSKCGLVTSKFTKTGSITSIIDQRSLINDSNRKEQDDIFTFGIITFTSGMNVKISRKIRDFTKGNIELLQPTPYDIQIGDQYSIIEGCNKTLTTCSQRFKNTVNFRGEPFVPIGNQINS